MPAAKTISALKCFMCGKAKSKEQMMFYHGKFFCCEAHKKNYEKKSASGAKSTKAGVCEFC